MEIRGPKSIISAEWDDWDDDVSASEAPSALADDSFVLVDARTDDSDHFKEVIEEEDVADGYILTSDDQLEVQETSFPSQAVDGELLDSLQCVSKREIEVTDVRLRLYGIVIILIFFVIHEAAHLLRSPSSRVTLMDIMKQDVVVPILLSSCQHDDDLVAPQTSTTSLTNVPTSTPSSLSISEQVIPVLSPKASYTQARKNQEDAVIGVPPLVPARSSSQPLVHTENHRSQGLIGGPSNKSPYLITRKPVTISEPILCRGCTVAEYEALTQAGATATAAYTLTTEQKPVHNKVPLPTPSSSTSLSQHNLPEEPHCHGDIKMSFDTMANQHQKHPVQHPLMDSESSILNTTVTSRKMTSTRLISESNDNPSMTDPKRVKVSHSVPHLKDTDLYIVDDPVVVLTPSIYRDFVSTHEQVFVAFYHPNDLDQRYFRELWHALAEQVIEKEVAIAIATVDCSERPRFCKKQDIRYFPALRFLDDYGDPIYPDNVDPRTFNDLLGFVQAMMRQRTKQKQSMSTEEMSTMESRHRRQQQQRRHRRRERLIRQDGLPEEEAQSIMRPENNNANNVQKLHYPQI